MGTKGEQFSAKLWYLKGCMQHLETESTNVINTLKYFKQVLLSIHVEKASSPESLPWPPIQTPKISKPSNTNEGNIDNSGWYQYLSTYPTLDYVSLHHIALSILRCLPHNAERAEICSHLLDSLCLTLSFMPYSIRVELPLQLAELLLEYESGLHGIVLDALCDSIVPMCFGNAVHVKNDSVLSAVIPAVLTIVFEFVTDSSLHMKLVESFMIFKAEVWKDIMMVIAFGSQPVKIYAVQYLFHYWPNLYSHGIANHMVTATSMPSMISCQNKSCKSYNDIVATTLICDPAIAAHYGGKHAPLYLCEACQNIAWDTNYSRSFFFTMLRKEKISYQCENKNCFSQTKTATVTLCGMYIGSRSHNKSSNKILQKHRARYCHECYSNLFQCFGDNKLLVQTSPPCLWQLETKKDKSVMVDAIISLLTDFNSSYNFSASFTDSFDKIGKISAPFYTSITDESMSSSHSGNSNNQSGNLQCLCKTCEENMWNTNGGTQCQFAIWMLTSLCPVKKKINENHMMSLLGATIQWCTNTTYLPSDDFGGKLENLKLKLMREWMGAMSTLHFNAFTSHLLPKKRIRKVTEHWDALCPEWQYSHKGLSLILCLGSYSIVQKEMWEKVMPFWLDLLHTKFDSIKENGALKEVIIKLFDVDLSPLPFETKYIFDFVLLLFEEPDVNTQMKGITWLQVLSKMEAIIPIVSLVQAFTNAVRILTGSGISHCDNSVMEKSGDEGTDGEDEYYDALCYKENNLIEVLKCCTAMLNILHEQMILQDVNMQTLVYNEWVETLLSLLTDTLSWFCSQKSLTTKEPTFQSATIEKDDPSEKDLAPKSNVTDDEKESAKQSEAKNHEEDDIFLKVNCNEDDNERELLIVWFRIAHDILVLVMPKKIKKETNSSQDGSDSIVDNFQCMSSLHLAGKLIETLSKQNSPLLQHLILQSLLLVCEACGIYEYISATDITDDPSINLCKQFPSLWTNTSLGFHDLFKSATSILLRALMMPGAADKFILTINDLLTDQDWAVRYDTINRIEHLLGAIELHHVQNRSSITQVISSCICSLLQCLDDFDKLEVQLKSTHVIENISIKTLKNVSRCLELEFTAVPSERSSILLYMQMLNRLRPDARLFSAFFSACMSYIVKWSRFQREQDGLTGYGLQRKRSADLSMDLKTTHLLIHVICKYFMEYSGDMKPSSETKCFQSLLRNFCIHFGYNDQVGYFTLKPTEVRNTVGFSSFLLNLPKILDSNIKIGKAFLPMAITLLQYSTFPELYSNNNQQITQQLTLHLLPEPLQQYWISSLLLILYKFGVTDYSQLMQLLQLTTVCLNTLESQFHLCSCEHSLMQTNKGNNESSDASSSHFALNAIVPLPNGPMSPKPPSKSKFSHTYSANMLDKYETSSLSNHGPISRSTTKSMATRRKFDGDSHTLISSSVVTQFLKRENRSVSVDSLSTNGSRSSPRSHRDYSRRRMTSENDDLTDFTGGQGTSQEDPLLSTNQQSEDDRSKIDSSDEDEKREKKESLSFSSSSISPYRRRAASDISREWNRVMNTSLQDAVADERCHKCGDKVMHFPGKALDSCIINLCYFTRFNLELAVPLLPRSLTQLVYISNLLGDGGKHSDANVPSKVSTLSSSCHIFTSASRAARQSIRCILQQLKGNLILTKIFLLPLNDSTFLHSLAVCLNECQHLNALEVVKYVLEGLPSDLSILTDKEFDSLLQNLSDYMSSLVLDSSSAAQWQQVINIFGGFCGKLLGVLPSREECRVEGLFSIVVIMLRAHAPTSAKLAFQESFSKLLAAVLQKSWFTVKSLYALCSTSSKIFAKTRDEFFLIRYVVSETISCLKLKTKFTYRNLIMLLQVLLVDIGSCVNPCAYKRLYSKNFTIVKMNMLPCHVKNCIKPSLSDCLDILLDCEFLYNFKEHVFRTQNPLLQGSLCADVKVSIAQVVCIELSKMSQQEKPLNTLLPWVYETPSNVQQGPKDYTDCVSHIRQLSWLLLGSLTHMGLFYSTIVSTWQPLPVELSPHLASIVQVVLTGFPSQYTESLTSVCSLFYGILFCQLWTLYCDELSYLLSSSNTGLQGASAMGWDQNPPSTLVMEFWSRVTPSILHLLKLNNPISELVHVHITSVMECLQQYNSAVVFKLYSLWKVMLECRLENRGNDSQDACMEMRLSKVHSFYASACKESNTTNSSEKLKSPQGEMEENIPPESRSTSHSNRSANKLLRIVHQIKERLADAETSGQTSEHLYVV